LFISRTKKYLIRILSMTRTRERKKEKKEGRQ